MQPTPPLPAEPDPRNLQVLEHMFEYVLTVFAPTASAVAFRRRGLFVLSVFGVRPSGHAVRLLFRVASVVPLPACVVGVFASAVLVCLLARHMSNICSILVLAWFRMGFACARL